MPGGVTPLSKWARKNARIRNEYVTGFIGEFLGNLVLCLFAIGAASTQEIHPSGYIVAVFGGVFGLMISVTAFGGLSGAHINPAVSLGLAMVGEMSWLKVPVYWVAQLLGSYIGAGIGYGLYEYRLRLAHCPPSDALCEIDSNNEEYLATIAGIFSPLPSVTPVGIAFADQVIATTVLFVAIMAAIDRRNMKVPTHLFGIFFALVVAGVAFCLGINAGGSMNPARDFGPRLMAVSIGCKSDQVFKSRMYDDPVADGNTHHYWLAPLFGPMLGAIFGGLIYVFLVGSHLKETDDEMKKGGQGGQGDSGDWRSTVFLPKANQPSGPQNGYGTGAPYGNGTTNNNVPTSGAYGAGVHNPGYVRDNPRPNY